MAALSAMLRPNLAKYIKVQEFFKRAGNLTMGNNWSLGKIERDLAP